MEKRSHFREAKSFAGTSSRTLGGPLSESNSASLGFCTCFVPVPALGFRVVLCPIVPVTAACRLSFCVFCYSYQ